MTAPLSPSRDDEVYTLFHTLAHDFSAPLRAIVEFSKLLSAECGDALSDDGKMYLSFVLGGGEKLQAMPQALVKLNRLKEAPSDIRPLQTNEIINECLKPFAAAAQKKGASIIVENMPDISGTKPEIKALLTELIDNALKFTQSGKSPYIHISGHKDDAKTIIEISDNGIGIDERVLERVFLPFKRLHDETAYPGAGMGLTIARALAAKNNGSLTLAANEQEGITARLILAC